MYRFCAVIRIFPVLLPGNSIVDSLDDFTGFFADDRGGVDRIVRPDGMNAFGAAKLGEPFTDCGGSVEITDDMFLDSDTATCVFKKDGKTQFFSAKVVSR